MQRGVRLLDADPDLGVGLDPDDFADARRQIVLPTVELEPAPIDLAQLAAAAGVRGEVLGFLVLSGALTIHVRIGIGQPCLRLVAPGELVLLDGDASDSFATVWGWSVLESAQLALFDDRLLVIGRRFPRLQAEILKRSAQQTRHALLQQAIGQLPRVEQRLLALMWSIADRRGTVRPDGVQIRLPVTQETLARMIGARRPTVSRGLKPLGGDGLITAQPGGWLLSHGSTGQFGESSAPPGDPRAASADA